MKQKGKFYKRGKSFIAVLVLLTGCSANTVQGNDIYSMELQALKPVEYAVEPDSFSLSLFYGDAVLLAALPGPERAVENLKQNQEETSWEYPEDAVSVSIKPEKEYLRVSVTSTAEEDASFQWPRIEGESYYMPFGEGKRIPQGEQNWHKYLSGKEFSVIEQFSMPFWASVYGDKAILYILENPYRSTLLFSEDSQISFSLLQEYPKIDKNKEAVYRIYVTDANPVSIAKIYRQYQKEQGRFVTLEQKAEENPNIRKLYGAPHIYLWGDRIITPENINWPAFRNSMDSDILKRVVEFASETELNTEAKQVWEEMASQDYVAQYQKNVVCNLLTEVLRRPDFYTPSIFPKQNTYIESLLKKGLENLSEMEYLQLNKHALAINLPEVFGSVEEWENAGTVTLMKQLKEAGITQAWIGLNSWEQAYRKPELVEAAIEQGYLIGPYDSYHSIHEPGKEKWITAKFSDSSLYEEASIQNKDGKKEAGFQNVGRKLNPAFSMPAVRQRTEEILKTGIPFNSWFIDCDATGEIYDDYTPEHFTTKQEDLKARLERMNYIKNEHNMVIGSEGGNDFAASVIAFAHGIELKSFSWMDEDMKSNQESEYFIGKYYSPTGGVAEHFAKQIPVKEEYYTVFIDPRYDAPLFKLVYNDSVITSYHWDWSTFKIRGAEEDRMLREILYNVPPLYHLDEKEWEKYQETISTHTKMWSEFSKKAILQEMTDFQYITEDGSVQMCRYGEELSVVSNFSEEDYIYGQERIPANSLQLTMDGKALLYTPTAPK